MTDHSSYVFSAYDKILSLSEEDILQAGHQMIDGNPIPSFDEDLLINLCRDVQNIFEKEDNILELEGDLMVVGDIHGSLHDLLRILKYIESKKCRVLFLGDYFDRGYFSLECITLLFSFKIKYPEDFYLIRGNHEFDAMCSNYGFKKEILNHHNPKKSINLVSIVNDSKMALDKVDCNFSNEQKEENKSQKITKEMLCDSYYLNHVSMNCHKYSEKLYNAFMEVFSYLPICAIVNHTSLCIHGGISPKLEKLDQINKKIRRPIIEFDQNMLLSDLLWGDPAHERNETSSQLYYDNPRGRGNLFSGIAVSNFLRSNNLKRIIRAHECVLNGTEQSFNEKCITVFSASSYNCQMGNSSGVLKITKEGDKIEPVTFPPLHRLDKSETNYYKVQAFEKETMKPTFNVLNGNIRASFSATPNDFLHQNLPDVRIHEIKSQFFYMDKEESENLKRSIKMSKKSKTTNILNCKKFTYNCSFNTGVHKNKSKRSNSLRFPMPLVDDFDVVAKDDLVDTNAKSEAEIPYGKQPFIKVVQPPQTPSQPMSCIIKRPQNIKLQKK